MKAEIAWFRTAVAQACSFGLSPAPGMIWATRGGPESFTEQLTNEARAEAGGLPSAIIDATQPTAGR